jgi:hypothetical protein
MKGARAGAGAGAGLGWEAIRNCLMFFVQLRIAHSAACSCKAVCKLIAIDIARERLGRFRVLDCGC